SQAWCRRALRVSSRDPGLVVPTVDTLPMVRDKVRIRFRKHGALRLVSHHDLMRCFERMLRRAALPFHSTEGFNPKPRLVFPLPRRLDLRPYLEALRFQMEVLEMDLRVTPKGTARPEEILEPLGLRALVDDGAILERLRLDLRADNRSPSPALMNSSGGQS